ncbi:hypothetical protein MMC12_000350 [Toensbergia leucococca]|nr:hypothetical protein [Toensbergia leucococca]
MPGMDSSRKVLLLGSGFVTRPTAELLSESGITVTVACRHIDASKKLTEGLKNAHPICLDVTDEVALVSPAMMELDKEAKEAGITVLNEIGLDPGIDHLYAVKAIDEVHKAGGKILSFLSYCGGLVGYHSALVKIHMSAKYFGVLLALRNSASYYKDGKVENVSSTELMGTAKPYFIYPGYAFVAYPNRDSTDYRERYDIPEAKTVIRGTLRFQGFPEFVKTLVDAGFLSEEPRDFLNAEESTKPLSWKEATAKILKSTSDDEKDLIWAISSKTKFASTAEKERIISGLRWIGLFSEDKITSRGNPLDTLCATLEEKMQYEAGERDLVMLQHKFEIENADGTTKTMTSTLVETGAPFRTKGWSAMAKLVGVPCAVGVKMVLDGRISEKGILAPVNERLAAPLRKELCDKHGIYMKEKVVV